MEIKILKPTDIDYPLVMKLVPFAEKYEIMKVDNLDVVPLFQVIDAISEVKADIVRRNGVECCPTCGKPVSEQDIVKPYLDKLELQISRKYGNTAIGNVANVCKDIVEMIDALLSEKGDTA